MKKIIFLFLLFASFSSPVSSSITAAMEQRAEIVIEDINPGYISVTPNDYMNAQSVTVKISDINNNVISMSETGAGQTVTFARTGREYKVTCVYHFEDQDSIIVDDVII